MVYADHTSGAQIAAQAAYAHATAGNLIGGALLDGWTRIRRWFNARNALRELRLLNPHLLNDIGLDTSDVPAEMPSSIIGMTPRI